MIRSEGNPGDTNLKTDASLTESLNSYFTSGISVRGLPQKSVLSQLDTQPVFATPNPYKQFAQSLQHPEAHLDPKSELPAESVASFRSSSVISRLNDHLSIHTGKTPVS